MKYKEVGKTNIKISTFGLGTWSLGGETKGKTSYGKISKRLSLNVLSKAIDLGINYIDTSPTYGFSQKLLGNILKLKRSKIILSTKVGLNNYFQKRNFSKKFISNQVFNILKELNTDYIDFIKLYCPDPRDKNLIEGYETLKAFKQKGIVRHIGITLNSPAEILKFHRNFDFEIVQCNFNLLDTRLLNSRFLNYIKKNKIGIIARTILNFGIFTEEFINNFNINEKKFKFINKNDHRNRWSNNQIKLWVEGAKIIKYQISRVKSIESIALRFPNSFDFISSSLIGVQNSNQLIQNLQKQNLDKLNKNEINKIISLNKKKNFFSDKKPKRIIN